MREGYEALSKEAISWLNGVLEKDERWKGYLGYNQLVIAEHLERLGDTQHFL